VAAAFAVPLEGRVEGQGQSAQRAEVPVCLRANEHVAPHGLQGCFQRTRTHLRDRTHQLQIDLQDGGGAAHAINHVFEEAKAHAFVLAGAQPHRGRAIEGVDLAHPGGFVVKAAIVEHKHRVVGEKADINFEAGNPGGEAFVDGLKRVRDMAARERGAVAAEQPAAAVYDGCEP